MALTRTYYSVDGKLRGAHRQGETHSRDYLHDALGSIVAVFQNGNQIAEGVYKPYGYRDGEWQMDSYKFSWNGGWGYRRTGMSYMANYVRARHYSQYGANWTTRDPLWPREMPYGYVEGRVMTAVDPSGKNVRPSNSVDRFGLIPPDRPIGCCDDEVLRQQWNEYIYRYCMSCYRRQYPDQECAGQCDSVARAYFMACKGDPGPGLFMPNSNGTIAPNLLFPFPSGLSFFPSYFKHTGQLASKQKPRYISNDRPPRPEDCGEYASMFLSENELTAAAQSTIISRFTQTCFRCCTESRQGPDCYRYCRSLAVGHLGGLSDWGGITQGVGGTPGPWSTQTTTTGLSR